MQGWQLSTEQRPCGIWPSLERPCQHPEALSQTPRPSPCVCIASWLLVLQAVDVTQMEGYPKLVE